MKYLKYLTIKNAIIAILVTTMFLSWLVEGISIVKAAVACIAVFSFMMMLLGTADKRYIREIKK